MYSKVTSWVEAACPQYTPSRLVGSREYVYRLHPWYQLFIPCLELVYGTTPPNRPIPTQSSSTPIAAPWGVMQNPTTMYPNQSPTGLQVAGQQCLFPAFYQHPNPFMGLAKPLTCEHMILQLCPKYGYTTFVKNLFIPLQWN